MNINSSILSKFKLNTIFSNIKFIKPSPDISKICNFYDKYQRSPFTPIKAYGPWLLTNDGKIVYDVGGYGMLGFGHNPKWLLDTLSKPHVMANVMTQSYEQERICNLLDNKIGLNTKNPYGKYSFLNSGSEAMELTLRIIDNLNYVKNYENIPSTTIVLKNGFHGRTFQAASISDSSKSKYSNTICLNKNINCVPININKKVDLYVTIESILRDKQNISTIVMEPVMGEGNPGISLHPSFYHHVRELSNKYNIPLVIDSVQAGIRANGCLSVVDYPGFAGMDGPDFEIFSKAISGGHYPLSVIAINKKYNDIDISGLYGNSMCANPKALDVCFETLSRVDNDLLINIQNMGTLFKNMLIRLKYKYPSIIKEVSGTGLLCAAHINNQIPVIGINSLEYRCRMAGLNVIHGGNNSLRFTPHFMITAEEINLVEFILDSLFTEV